MTLYHLKGRIEYIYWPYGLGITYGRTFIYLLHYNLILKQSKISVIIW